MQTVYFIGVATARSRIHALFPHWMDALGIEARIEGVDVPLRSPRSRYRELVRTIAHDPGVAGAVITAHKLGVYDAALDLFEEMDGFVTLCHEVSAIAKRDGALTAHTRDPLAASSTLRAMLGAGYWLRNTADVLCLGAGGAATTIALCLLGDQLLVAGEPAGGTPRRTVFVDIDRSRLDGLRRFVEKVHSGEGVEYLHHRSGAENDEVMRSLQPSSVIINATGMGKDRPGSPLTDRAIFPRNGVVWDLNYRGELTFLAQARAQQEEHHLSVHDGRLYFHHGWTQSLAPILDVDLSPVVFREDAAT